MLQQAFGTNDYLEDILTQINIGTWEWNLLTDDVTWSENMSHLLKGDSTKGKIQTTRNQCVSSIYKDDYSFVEKEINNCIHERKNLKIEYRVIWPDNTIHWVQSRGTVIYSEDNVPSNMLGIMVDITERKNMEQVLFETNELVAMQNKAKSDFLTSMSHELKNPLNVVIGYSQLLSGQSNITDDQNKSLEIISRAGEHINGLVNEILDLASIEAGKVSLTIERISLTKILYECVELISITAKEQRQNISVNIGECDNQYINVDRKRFTQIMLNLLSNAVKYNQPHGDIHVSCKQAGDKVCISIKDNGLGLSDNQQNQLFQPFQRLGAETTNIPGTGMGLVITKQLIELMNGHIGVESTLGRGSIFWIECPCV